MDTKDIKELIKYCKGVDPNYINHGFSDMDNISEFIESQEATINKYKDFVAKLYMTQDKETKIDTFYRLNKFLGETGIIESV